VRISLLLLVASLALGSGCARRIVASPEMARSQNDLDWKVEREPQPPPPPPPPVQIEPAVEEPAP
jgi:hypothetical protein